MVICPCSMGTLPAIAVGASRSLVERAADVALKERRPLILVPREMPLSLVHVRNMELLLLAGATILPANPFFYTNPKIIEEVVDTVVARVIDHMGLPQKLIARWQEEQEETYGDSCNSFLQIFNGTRCLRHFPTGQTS